MVDASSVLITAICDDGVFNAEAQRRREVFGVKNKTIISALVRERRCGEAAQEAWLGVADGADTVIFDLSEMPKESLTADTYRKLVKCVPVPVSFCCYDLSDSKRLPPIDGPMVEAASCGAAYVDVSPSTVAAAKERGAKVIISEHLLDRSASFDEAKEIFRRQRDAGADVAKLVARMDTQDEFEDAKRVMAYLRDEFDLPWIYLGLGTHGFEQRFLGPEYGAAMTFALHRPFPGKKDQPLIKDFKEKSK